MQIGILGINHKMADLSLRDHLAKLCHHHFGPGCFAHDSEAFVLLSTCNRTEVFFSSENLADTHSYLLNVLRNETEALDKDFDQKLYSYFGFDCFLHLARVTAGLDSAILGETEIQGQVKQAYETMATSRSLPSELHFLFQKSLKIGKQIRTELCLERGTPHIEQAIVQTGHQFFEDPRKAKILLVGASDINKKVLHYLQGKQFTDITVVNRTQEKAIEVAQEHDIGMLDWNFLADHWNQYDWILFGTKSPNFLELRGEAKGHKLLIDLGVPRNIDPLMGEKEGILLQNIDEINQRVDVRKERISCLLGEAEKMASEATLKQIRLFHKRQSTPHPLAIAMG